MQKYIFIMTYSLSSICKFFDYANEIILKFYFSLSNCEERPLYWGSQNIQNKIAFSSSAREISQ